MTGIPIKAIIFDLGNVLINFDHRIAARKISPFADKPPEEIYNLFFDSKVTRDFEEGKISPQDFFLKVKSTLNLKLDYDKFLPIWNEIFFFTQENKDLYNLANNLKKQYRLTILSNINALHFDYLKKEFPIFDAFHYLVTSFETGSAKPSLLIYQKALYLLKTSPQETLYIDDRQDLVREALKLKLRSYVYKGVEQLKKDFLVNGIDINR